VYHRPLLHRLDIDSVVVFRALQLGDMLCAVPALRALRTALPKARITLVGLPWASQFATRFRSYIDDFVPFPGHPLLPEQPVRQAELTPFYASMCARKFTLALQLHGNGGITNEIVAGFGAHAMAGHCVGEPVSTERTVLFPYPEIGAESGRLLSLVERLGASAVGDYLEFPLAQEDRQELEASGVAAGLKPGSYICVHPGASKRDKCWPARKFAEVADHLAAEFGVDVALTGSAEEAGLAADVARHMQARGECGGADLDRGDGRPHEACPAAGLQRHRRVAHRRRPAPEERGHLQQGRYRALGATRPRQPPLHLGPGRAALGRRAPARTRPAGRHRPQPATHGGHVALLVARHAAPDRQDAGPAGFFDACAFGPWSRPRTPFVGWARSAHPTELDVPRVLGVAGVLNARDTRRTWVSRVP